MLFVYATLAMRAMEVMLRTATVFSTEDVKAMARFNEFYTAMSNITFPPEVDWGGGSPIVSPKGRVLAEDKATMKTSFQREFRLRSFAKTVEYLGFLWR